MIIECSACSKKFTVPDSAINVNGRLVQCSSCGNKWTQYPVKKEQNFRKIETAFKNNKPKKTKTKKAIKKGPVPYSKEYMKQKWGTTIDGHVVEKEISKKNKKVDGLKRKDKKRISEDKVVSGFGFFNYIITLSVISIFLLGILNFEKSRLSRKFPFLEPYINNFYETLENFKILIIDLIT